MRLMKNLKIHLELTKRTQSIKDKTKNTIKINRTKEETIQQLKNLKVNNLIKRGFKNKKQVWKQMIKAARNSIHIQA